MLDFTKTQVLIWDVEAQPNRHAVLGATNSRPDLVHIYCQKVFFLIIKCVSYFLFSNFFLNYHWWKIHPLLSEQRASLWICIVMSHCVAFETLGLIPLQKANLMSAFGLGDTCGDQPVFQSLGLMLLGWVTLDWRSSQSLLLWVVKRL